MTYILALSRDHVVAVPLWRARGMVSREHLYMLEQHTCWFILTVFMSGGGLRFQPFNWLIQRSQTRTFPCP